MHWESALRGNGCFDCLDGASRRMRNTRLGRSKTLENPIQHGKAVPKREVQRGRCLIQFHDAKLGVAKQEGGPQHGVDQEAARPSGAISRPPYSWNNDPLAKITLC